MAGAAHRHGAIRPSHTSIFTSMDNLHSPSAHDGFDTRLLETYLASRLPGFGGKLEVTRFKGGQSNPTYRLDTRSRSYVMRTKPAPVAKLLPSAHAIEREFRVMQALHGTDVPVPEVHLLCEDESIIGRAFYIMELVQGRIFWDQSLPELTRSARVSVYDEMNRVIAALHKLKPADIGLDDFGKPGNYFERQIARWTKQYRASATKPAEPIEAMDRLIDWLPQNIPPTARDESRTALVHGDFRLDNLVFNQEGTRAIGVLDWELSTLGHPLADLSYHCLGWHVKAGPFEGIAGLDHATLGIPDERQYIMRYCIRTGRLGELDAILADWNFYLAYNLFRLAGILQGIAQRASLGIASNEKAKATGAYARPFAELAWELASG